MKRLIFLLSALGSLNMFPVFAASMNDKDDPPYIPAAEPEVRAAIAAWQDLKFGMFIHWGPYSQWGVVESWSICPEEYDFCMVRPEGMNYFDYVKRYEALKTTFNPQQFDPDKWAAAAQYAGMKYVVFTAKHHDGFNMFDTKYSDYKVTDTYCPFSTHPRANIAREIFDAFRARGMMAGAYYSIADWHHDDYWWRYLPPKDRNINYSPSKFPEKWERFNTFVDNQLDELTDGSYGPLGILWFDLCDASTEQRPQWERFARTVRTNQPEIMMVARHQHTIYENYRTPEQRIPDKALDYPWESCMTMATQWSYKPNDTYKSARTILSILVQIVSRGGNLLLNVGPGPNGDLDPVAYERLREIGDWMQVNGEGIYGTKAVAPYKEDKLVYTMKGDYVYAFYLSDEENPEVPEKITIRSFVPAGGGITFLGYKKSLPWRRTSDGIEIEIPEPLQDNPPCNYIWGLRFRIR